MVGLLVVGNIIILVRHSLVLGAQWAGEEEGGGPEPGSGTAEGPGLT